MKKTVVLYPGVGGGFVSMGNWKRPERVRFAALPTGLRLPRPRKKQVPIDPERSGMAA